MNSLVFKNGQLVLPDQVVFGNVSVMDGCIAALDSGPAAQAPGWDLQGDYLMPGFVEMHTDNFERHLMPRPKVQWAEMPALLAHDAEVAAAGITTVFDALGVGDADPDSLRGSTWDSVLQVLETCSTENLLRADHHIHVRCELPAPNTIDLFAPFHDHPRLSLISLMDHTPGQRQWENIDVARVYYTGKKGWSNEKFERQVQHAAELQARYAAPHRAYFVEYCHAHHIALASHDDTTAAHVLQAHEEGASAVVRLVDDGIYSLPQAVATVSHNPAQATGLHDRGQIAQGLRADLIQVRFVVLPQGGRHAVVRAVWREGQRVL